MANLISWAKKKIEDIGAAPHPVQINSPEAIQKIQTAKYGVLAQGNNRNVAVNQLNNAQAASKPTVATGLNNAMDAFNNTNAQAGRFVVQNGITKPGMEIAQSVRQQVTHKPSSYTPTSGAAKAIFGDAPIQSLQVNNATTRSGLQHNSNPLVRGLATPLSYANTALHVANDVPVVGAAVKYGTKAAAKGAPLAVKAAENIAPKAVPALQATAQGLKTASQTLDRGAVATTKAIGGQIQASNAKKSLVASSKASIQDLNKQKAMLQQRIANSPINAHSGVETTQRHIDQIDGRINQIQANAPKLSLKDRILAPDIGLNMKAVHSPDLNPEQNKFIEEYAQMLKDQGQGNGVDMVKTADGYKRVSNNMRDASVKGQQLNNSYWFEKARKEIESGKAAYGASDDYKTVGQIQDAPPLDIPDGFDAPTAPASPATKSLPPQSDVALPQRPQLPKTAPRVQGEGSLVNTSKLNTDRLNTDAESKAILDTETQAIIGRLGNDEVQKYAKSAGIDTRTHTPEQTKQIIAEQLNVRQDAVRLLAESKKATDVESKAALIKQAAERGRTSREQGTDIARQLQARKIIANELDTPEQRLFKLLDTAGVNPDIYSRKLANVDFADSKQVVKAFRELVPAKAANWLDTLRYNSMLSSPLTQAVNIFGNAQGIVIGAVEKNLRGNIDAIGGLFGNPRQYARGEGTAYGSAAARSIGEASHNFVDALRGTGKYANSDLEEYSMPLATKGAAGVAYKTLSFPMRVLDGMDKFFRTVAENGEEAALLRRESKGIAVTGNRDALKKAEADYRVFQTEMGAPGQGILNQTFDEFAKNIMRFRNSKNPLISLPAKFTIPFVKTVNNINKQGIVDYSPLGLVNLKGNADKTTAITRAVMGSAVFGASAALVAQGQMTWAEPRNADERAQFRADGKQPYAIRFGDKWIGFSKLHPAVSFPMAMTAALNDALANKKTDQGTVDAVLEAVSKYGNFLSDQSYAKSIGDTLGAIGGDKEAVAKAVSNNVQQVVPFRALTGWIARISDGTERKVDTSKGYIAQQVESLMQQYPGLRQNTTTRDNAGIPIAANNQVFNGFSPVKVTSDRTGQGFNAGGTAVDVSSSKSSSSSRTDVNSQIQAAFSTPEGRKFIALNDAGKKAAARSDPNTRALYDQYEAMKKGLSTSTTLRPADLSPESMKTLDNYDRLTTKARDAVLSRNKDAEYKYELAKYENDKKSGNLSTTEDIRRQQELAKAQVGSEFDKEVRDIYGLNKTQVYQYITTNPNGKDLADKLIAYGDSLEGNDLGDNKFRDSKGNIAFAPKDKNAAANKKASLDAITASINASKAGAAQRAPKSASKAPSFAVKAGASPIKRAALKQYATKKPSVNLNKLARLA